MRKSFLATAHHFYRLFAAVAFLYAVLLAASLPAYAEVAYTPLVVEGKDGASHAFEVELALTTTQRSKGLMYRTELAPDKGMLFIFPDVQPRSFWMHNTYISLDILFLAADGTIINIVKNAEPETDDPRVSVRPAKAVLELQAGRSDALGLAPGDIVKHVFLGNMGKN